MIRFALGIGLFASAAAAQAPGASTGATPPAATAFAMGEAFRLGKGMPIDRDQAIAWYGKAAAQGHEGAKDALGLMLFTRGERKQAIPLLQTSAARGDPRALYILGTAHFNGDYVPRDTARAYAEMKRAAAAGLPEAQRNLAKMEPYITADDRAKAAAIEIGGEQTAGSRAAPSVAAQPQAASPASATIAAPIPSPAPIGSPAPHTATAPASVANPLPLSPPTIIDAGPDMTTDRSYKPASARPAPLRSPPIGTAASASLPPVSAGRWRIQLGAYRTAGQAENQWRMLAERVPGIATLSHAVTQAGDFWRLQADGIADRAAAERMCRATIAAGGACFTIAP